MLALGLLAHRQRHPSQLLAPPRAIRFGLERNRRRVLDSTREDPIHDVFERVERLPMPSDQNPRAVALDFYLDRLRIDLDLPYVGRLAHLLEDLLEDSHRLDSLLLDVRAFASRGAAVIVAGRRLRSLTARAAVAASAPLILAPARTPVSRIFAARLRRLPCCGRRRRRRRPRGSRRIRGLARHSHPRRARAQSEHARARRR